MLWTTHGWWIGHGLQPVPLLSRLDCGGPHRCPECAVEAQHADADTARRQRMVAVGASPDDVERLTAMLRVVGRFGHRLGGICDDAAVALEELAAATTPAAADAEARQRVDDTAEEPGD